MTGNHLVLRPATAQESKHIHDINSVAWAGDLDLETYHGREHVLASTPLTRNGGLSCWVLVNPADEPQRILSSCESIKKDAFVSKPPQNGEQVSTVKQVTAHGIGSVFTPSDQREKGHAGIMLKLLAETLTKGNADGLTVLYSDIGKNFYAKHGWMPHKSSHLEFPRLETGVATGIKYLRSSDIPSLCVKDIAALQESLSRPPIDLKTRVGFIPDYQTMEWHWAREEFVAPVLRKHIDIKPEIKGAITPDGKRWMIWTRDFGKTVAQLYVLRYVNMSRSLDESEEEEQVANLFRAAGLEAHKWGLQKVTFWNPNETCIRAARRVAGDSLQVVDRESDSIACLMMHDQSGSQVDEVDWVANEKFAWC